MVGYSVIFELNVELAFGLASNNWECFLRRVSNWDSLVHGGFDLNTVGSERFNADRVNTRKVMQSIGVLEEFWSVEGDLLIKPTTRKIRATNIDAGQVEE